MCKMQPLLLVPFRLLDFVRHAIICHSKYNINLHLLVIVTISMECVQTIWHFRTQSASRSRRFMFEWQYKSEYSCYYCRIYHNNVRNNIPCDRLLINEYI